MERNRAIRFCDIGNQNSLFETKNLSVETAKFFISDKINYRMEELRCSLLNIRRYWSNSSYKKIFLEKITHILNLPGEKLLTKDWFDLSEIDQKQDFSIIKTYTSDEGYDKVFSVMNGIFRSEIENKTDYDTAALLLEYMNIELYNYIHLKNKQAANFSGTIYRGSFLPSKIVKDFIKLQDLPVCKRKISVPLSLMSCSVDFEIAKGFLTKIREEELRKKYIANCVPVIFEIHVANLDSKYIELYHSYYPDSIVSSICAVPIGELSVFPEEKEVLLRGAFFQVIDTSQSNVLVEGTPIHIFKLVMLNSNRDHLTTSKFENTNARNLFNKLVELTRLRVSGSLIEDTTIQKLYLKEENNVSKQLEEIKKLCNNEKEKKGCCY